MGAETMLRGADGDAETDDADDGDEDDGNDDERAGGGRRGIDRGSGRRDTLGQLGVGSDHVRQHALARSGEDLGQAGHRTRPIGVRCDVRRLSAVTTDGRRVVLAAPRNSTTRRVNKGGGRWAGARQQRGRGKGVVEKGKIDLRRSHLARPLCLSASRTCRTRDRCPCLSRKERAEGRHHRPPLQPMIVIVRTVVMVLIAMEMMVMMMMMMG